MQLVRVTVGKMFYVYFIQIWFSTRLSLHCTIDRAKNFSIEHVGDESSQQALSLYTSNHSGLVAKFFVLYH